MADTNNPQGAGLNQSAGALDPALNPFNPPPPQTGQEKADLANAKADTKPKSKPANKDVKTPVRLLYDTWDADGNRVEAGAVVKLPLDAAKQLLAEKKAERADPLPGEQPED